MCLLDACFLAEAAKGIGVAPITLKRWLLEGRFPEVQTRQERVENLHAGKYSKDQSVR